MTHSEPEPAAARAATAAAREDQIAKQTDVERRTDRARGLMLGLALGESTGLGRHQSGSPTINAGVATQLAAFTLEGYIRAAVRFSHRGICHPPSVIWRAYCRWGIGQGIDGLHASAMPGSGGDRSGWLCHVPALRERRGDAPRTVAALLGGRQGTIAEPLNSSMGWHGLVRTLPLIVGHWRDLRFDPSLTRDVTALTHGSPLALDVSSAAVAIGACGCCASCSATALISAGSISGSSPCTLTTMVLSLNCRWRATSARRSVPEGCWSEVITLSKPCATTVLATP